MSAGDMFTAPRTDAEIAAELNARFGEPVEGRDFGVMPDRTPAGRLDPAALFNDLIRKARPGMTRVEALANGAHYRAQIGAADGMTADDFAAWAARNRGLSLIVHLDPTGEPCGVHLLPHDEADEYVQLNPNAVVAAMWGIGS